MDKTFVKKLKGRIEYWAPRRHKSLKKSNNNVYKPKFQQITMAFKINVAQKGITKKYETENEDLVGTKIGDKIDGKLISEELEGYEIEITGTSDKAGFMGRSEINGVGLKKVLLTRGKGMWDKRKGVRLRKTVRGNEISLDTVQINTIVSKEGKTKFAELGKKDEAPAEEDPAAE